MHPCPGYEPPSLRSYAWPIGPHDHGVLLFLRFSFYLRHGMTERMPVQSTLEPCPTSRVYIPFFEAFFCSSIFSNQTVPLKFSRFVLLPMFCCSNFFVIIFCFLRVSSPFNSLDRGLTLLRVTASYSNKGLIAATFTGLIFSNNFKTT